MRAASYISAVVDGILLWSDTPASAVGTVVTSGSDSSVSLTHWVATPWNIYGGTTVGVVADAVKGKAIRFYGLANQYGQPVANYGGYQNQRGEQSPTLEVSPGQTIWIGFDMWLASGIGLSSGWQGLFQLKSETEGSPNLTVGVNEANYSDGSVLHLTSATGPSGTPNQSYSLGATPSNTWIRLVLGLNITQDGTTSWVEAWRDGTRVVTRRAWATYNQASGGPYGGLLYSDAASGYLKFGVYRSPANWDVDYRLANVRIGTGRGIVS